MRTCATLQYLGYAVGVFMCWYISALVGFKSKMIFLVYDTVSTYVVLKYVTTSM